MYGIYLGKLKDAENYAKLLFVRVDEKGEILSDYLKYGWTKQSLSIFLGTSTNFSNQRFLQSSCSTIRLVAVYPNQQLDDDMDIKQEALLTFELNAQQNCPQVVCMYNYTSYINVDNGLQELQKLFKIDPIQFGSGLWGSVHKAQEKKTGKWFAMKIIKIKNEEYQSIIQNEILLIRKIKSPNVIEIKEHYMIDDKAFIIMEKGEKDLQKYINERKKTQSPLSEQEFTNIALQICEAVKATHDCGIMHRDLKPPHFVFCQNNIIKLIGFGFARECEKGSSVLGTPQYWAPEIIQQEKYSNAVDIFSLGCIFYLLMTFKDAFISNAEILSKDPAPSFPSIFSKDICDLCIQMLSKKPEIRPNITAVMNILKSKIKINYEVRRITHKSEFDQLMQQSQQTQKQLQIFVDELINKIPNLSKSRPTDRQINPLIFREICENIILNHVHWGNDIDVIKADIQHVLDNYSVKNSADGTHYGDNTTQKQIQFQKHIAKYPGGTLVIQDEPLFFDNDSFISPIINGQKFGIVQFLSTNGEVYIGGWENNCCNGYGQLMQNGEILQGIWASGQLISIKERYGK